MPVKTQWAFEIVLGSAREGGSRLDRKTSGSARNHAPRIAHLFERSIQYTLRSARWPGQLTGVCDVRKHELFELRVHVIGLCLPSLGDRRDGRETRYLVSAAVSVPSLDVDLFEGPG